jgi:hypothetical protein
VVEGRRSPGSGRAPAPDSIGEGGDEEEKHAQVCTTALWLVVERRLRAGGDRSGVAQAARRRRLGSPRIAAILALVEAAPEEAQPVLKAMAEDSLALAGERVVVRRRRSRLRRREQPRADAAAGRRRDDRHQQPGAARTGVGPGGAAPVLQPSVRCAGRRRRKSTRTPTRRCCPCSSAHWRRNRMPRSAPGCSSRGRRRASARATPAFAWTRCARSARAAIRASASSCCR